MKELGGYIELELPQKQEYHNTLALNCGRNCVRYLIRAYNIKTIHVPIFQCPLVFDAIRKENCEIIFYELDDHFFPKKEFGKDDFILYVNYFGLNDRNVKVLEKKYPHLIVDNSQAFYSKPAGLASFYSCRKFFGVSDGAYLYTDKKIKEDIPQDHDSYNRFSHLLKRIESGSNFGYKDFKVNDGSLDTEDIKLMSNLTHYILKGADYEKVAKIRRDNFEYLQKKLSKFNQLSVALEDQVPLFYPFLFKSDTLRDKFIKSDIFVSTFWDGLEKYYTADSWEARFQKYLFPLIIDQRCSFDDLERQIAIIKQEVSGA